MWDLYFKIMLCFLYISVFNNVAFGLKMRKVSKTEIKKRVMKALELISLNGLENRNIKELSGGQQQRVALSSVNLLKKLG